MKSLELTRFRIQNRSVPDEAHVAGIVLTVLKREQSREWCVVEERRRRVLERRTCVHSLVATRLPLTFWNVPKMTSGRRMQEYVRVVNGTEHVSQALMEAEW
ncbi:hypothetical protein LR48_Vigan187s002700 [Vigna angularis]|uniref:Uncharacterized protein n=1 Tax=Phaseolus angularis TaxID=3914 RepID=A0A0L9T5C7_PHAAN|nr:hypothetical protein LR48_Vigan187s002700 [Vigna angularis]